MAFKFAEKLVDTNLNNTLIVDALNIAFRYKHTHEYKTFRYKFIDTVHSIANSYRSKKLIIAADWGASSYRKDIYPDYKADRAERFKDQTEEDRIAFQEFFEEFESTLKLLEQDAIVLRYQGVEADDIAAHLVKRRKAYELENIWLISSDRDWGLLVQEGVSQFSTVTRKEYTLENWAEHYNVTIAEYISLKCLMGDKGDNIPGIPGIGPVRATQLIKEYGSALDLYDAVPINSHYQYIKNLNEHADRILINYELMDLLTYCDEAIGKDNLENIRLKMGDVAW